MGIFGNAFGWPHLLIILAVILLLFGAARLPALARSIGQSARAFRGEMKAMKDEDKKDDGTPAESTAATPVEGTVTSEAANGTTAGGSTDAKS
jgi:sec-independent protein translocase protein TatA